MEQPLQNESAPTENVGEEQTTSDIQRCFGPEPAPLTQEERRLLESYRFKGYEIKALNTWLSNPSIANRTVNGDISKLLSDYAGSIIGVYSSRFQSAEDIRDSLEALRLQDLPSVFDIQVECEEKLRLPSFYLGSKEYFDVGALSERRPPSEMRKSLLNAARPAVLYALACGRTAIWNLVGPKVQYRFELRRPGGPPSLPQKPSTAEPPNLKPQNPEQGHSETTNQLE